MICFFRGFPSSFFLSDAWHQLIFFMWFFYDLETFSARVPCFDYHSLIFIFIFHIFPCPSWGAGTCLDRYSYSIVDPNSSSLVRRLVDFWNGVNPSMFQFPYSIFRVIFWILHALSWSRFQLLAHTWSEIVGWDGRCGHSSRLGSAWSMSFALR